MNPNLKFQMKNKVYVYHTDPGHGWLAVKKREIIALGFSDKVSRYSYVKGDTVYLEEDNDLALFFNAYRQAFGKDPKYRNSYLERTPIRYYDSVGSRTFERPEQPSWEDTARMWITGDTE